MSIVRRSAVASLAVTLLLGAGCVSDRVRESAETVLTLQSGTIAELRERRGRGPFAAYDVAPDEMIGILEAAARKARGLGGLPVTAVFASPARGEVVAKERAPADAKNTGYEGAFRTAMVAIVHPVAGRPQASRVEIHALQRGPFHGGQVAWERDMPRWIHEVIAERAAIEIQPPAILPDPLPDPARR